MNNNASERKPGQFHQGQCVVGAERETEACQIHKYPDNLKKNLPKKADCMVSYKYNSFLGSGGLFLDNSILPQTSEELFYFATKRMP